MTKSCNSRSRNWVIPWFDNWDCINDVIVGTNKYPKLCPSPWSKPLGTVGALVFPSMESLDLSPTPKQQCTNFEKGLGSGFQVGSTVGEMFTQQRSLLCCLHFNEFA